MPTTNHYSVLGLDPSGKNTNGEAYTDEEISDAYRKLTNEGNDQSKLIEFSNSYRILFDVEQRKAFDDEIRSNFTPPSVELNEDKLCLQPYLDMGALNAKEINTLSVTAKRLCLKGMSRCHELNNSQINLLKRIFKKHKHELDEFQHLPDNLFEVFAKCFFDSLFDLNIARNEKSIFLMAYVYFFSDELNKEGLRRFNYRIFQKLFDESFLERIVSHLVEFSPLSLEKILHRFSESIMCGVFDKTMDLAIEQNPDALVKLRLIDITQDNNMFITYFQTKTKISYPDVENVLPGCLLNAINNYIEQKLLNSSLTNTNHASLNQYFYNQFIGNQLSWTDLSSLGTAKLRTLAKKMYEPSAMELKADKYLALQAVDDKKLKLCRLLNYGFDAESINTKIPAVLESVCLKVLNNMASFEGQSVHPLKQINEIYQSAYWTRSYWNSGYWTTLKDIIGLQHLNRKDYGPLNKSDVERLSEGLYQLMIQDVSSDDLTFFFHVHYFPFQLQYSDLACLLNENGCADYVLRRVKALVEAKLVDYLSIDKGFSLRTQKYIVRDMNLQAVVDYVGGYEGDSLDNNNNKKTLLCDAINKLFLINPRYDATLSGIEYLYELLHSAQVGPKDITDWITSGRAYELLQKLAKYQRKIFALNNMVPTIDLFALTDAERIPLLLLKTDSFTVEQINALNPIDTEFGLYLVTPDKKMTPEVEELSIEHVVRVFGESILTKLRNSRLYGLKQESLSSGWQKHLTIGGFTKLNSENALRLIDLAPHRNMFLPHFRITSPDNDVFKLKRTHYNLLKLWANEWMKAEEINKLDTDSLVFEIYTHFAQSDSITKPMHERIKTFCASEYYQFLNGEILMPMREQLEIVRRQNGGHREQKIHLMSCYIDQIVDSMSYLVCNSELFGEENQMRLIHDAHESLKFIVTEAINDPILNKPNDQIRAFFLKILGVILATICLFLPLLSPGFRQTFFADSSEIQRMKAVLASAEKMDEKVNPDEARNPTYG